MYLKQFFVEGLGHASYLIGSDSSKEAAVVDPNRNVGVYLEAAQHAGLKIRYVFETHVHNDFLSGAKAIADKLHADYVASAEAGLKFPYRAVREGDRLQIGELDVRVLFTPGHTPEHVSYAVADTTRAEVPVLIFTGGDLLVGSVGRPDLLGRELGEKLAPQLYDSLFNKIMELEDYVEVLPTHGAGSLCGRSISSKRTSTIGYERRFNPFLQRTDQQAFVNFVLDGNPYVPAYYANMRPGNQAGSDGFSPPAPRPLSVAEVQHMLGHGAIALDTRAPAAFGGGHIPGALNVELGPLLATWVGSLVPSGRSLVLVLDRESDWAEVVGALGRIGYEQIGGYLQGGMPTWQEQGLPLAHVEQIDVAELDRRRRSQEDLQIVDVRMDNEWEAGHIPGARHAPLTDLPRRLEEVQRGLPTAVICGSGYRSSIASSLLREHGVTTLTNVLGGMTAWAAADLPMVKPFEAGATASEESEQLEASAAR